MRVCFSSISLILVLISTISAAESNAQAGTATPFVAGFDRFGKHDEISAPIARDLLLTELSCTACHRSDNVLLAPKSGPDLSAAGTRLSNEWLRKYLTQPQQVKPGSTMPNVLHGISADDKTATVEALVAFLSTQQIPFPTLKANGIIPVEYEFWLKGNVAHGEELYHAVGCIACHSPDDERETGPREASSLDKLLEQLDPDELKELGLSGAARIVNSVPHRDLNAKYTKLSLAHFLLKPDAVRHSGRMPNMKLLPNEAADIATYLLRNQKSTKRSVEAKADSALVAKGKDLFLKLGCINCHELKGLSSTAAATTLAKLDFNTSQSCLENPKPAQPAYSLSEDQMRLIKTASNEKPSADDQLSLRMLQLNCLACHERNKLGGIGRKRQPHFETVGQVDIGDEGRLPPSLTHVGQKLTPAWFAKVLDGKGDIRPHMTPRMPIFPKSFTKDLPQQFAAIDHASNKNEQQVFGDIKDLATTGRDLLNTGCIQCHPLRGESLASVVGTDLHGVTGRVRPEWFKSFLLNPIELKNRTRMPTFFPNGVASNKEILDGNVDQQIAAIWVYLKENEKHPLPEKILEARSKNFELVPTDKPIVLRTFMKSAGTHAIAVGFPEKVNFAFDANACRLVEAWKEPFLDAHGTWFNRFTPLEEPLGTERVKMTTFLGVSAGYFSEPPKGFRENLKLLNEKYFRGYQLDKDGIPTFRYHQAGRLIEDRIAPGKAGELHRRIKISSEVKGTKIVSPSMSLHLLSGKTIRKVNENTWVNDGGLTVTLKANSPLEPVTLKLPDQKHVIVSIPKQDPIEFEIIYKW